jgi:hypothetical protein
MPVNKFAKVSAPPFQLSLHIRHPSLDPREISRELQFEADEAFSAGEQRKVAGGAISPMTLAHQETYWAAILSASFFGDFAEVARELAAVPERNEPELFIAWACARLLSRDKTFVQRIRAEGGSLSLVATLFGRTLRAFTLSPELARQVSELGMAINFEFVRG